MIFPVILQTITAQMTSIREEELDEMKLYLLRKLSDIKHTVRLLRSIP